LVWRLGTELGTCELTCSSSHHGGSRATLGRCGPLTGHRPCAPFRAAGPLVERPGGLPPGPPLRPPLLDGRAGPRGGGRPPTAHDRRPTRALSPPASPLGRAGAGRAGAIRGRPCLGSRNRPAAIRCASSPSAPSAARRAPPGVLAADPPVRVTRESGFLQIRQPKPATAVAQIAGSRAVTIASPSRPYRPSASGPRVVGRPITSGGSCWSGGTPQFVSWLKEEMMRLRGTVVRGCKVVLLLTILLVAFGGCTAGPTPEVTQQVDPAWSSSRAWINTSALVSSAHRFARSCGPSRGQCGAISRRFVSGTESSS
jgi:hypothetical protein